MGLTLVWVAVRKSAGAALLRALDFERVGDASDELGSSYCCAETPEGWLVLTLARDGLASDQAVSQAPAAVEILAFEMNETVMFSGARAFRDGKLVWSVIHDPDRDWHGVTVEGTPPSQLVPIRKRLEAKEAADPEKDVDYLFDVPLDLSRALCGYQPLIDLGLEWSIVQKRSGVRTAGPAPRRPSLLAGMRSELLPFLRSLGWEVQGDKPDLSGSGDIVRRIDGVKQLMWFDYAQGQETYIVVEFCTVDESGPAPWRSMDGRVVAPALSLPWWKRFTWKRLKALADAPPAPSDVPSVLEQARREILIADTFLKTGETNGRIRAEYRRPPQVATGGPM